MKLETNKLPAPDDLAGWKAIEYVLNERIIDRIRGLRLVTPDMLRQYFGCRNEEYLLKEYDNLSVMHAFIEWFVNDYRPVLRSGAKNKKGRGKRRHVTRRGKTLAEKMLAEALPAGEAKILESCSQVHPSIFVSTNVVPGESLTVEDMLIRAYNS